MIALDQKVTLHCTDTDVDAEATIIRIRPANPAIKWNLQTAMTALIGPNFKHLRRSDTIKPHPIKPLNTVV